MEHKDNQKLDFDKILLQVYRQPVTNTRPEEDLVSLRRILTGFAEPGNRIIEIFELIQQAEREGNQKEKARLKTKYLLYFTPCVVVFPKRDYQSIRYFTGILVLDFDHINNAAEFKQFLFEKYNCVIACWLSPSRRGVKALVKIPVVKTIAEFKEYFYGISTEMDQYGGFDHTGQNCVLPLFQSYDPDLLERNDPDTWQVKAILPPPLPLSPTINTLAPISDKQRQKASEIIFKGFSTQLRNITDIGHPVVRRVAYTAGGYIAGGQLDESDLLMFMDAWIDGHPYLRQKSGTYQRTVRDMVARGKLAPLSLAPPPKPNTHQLDDFLICNS